jgi:UDP-2,4-diacetamido-2,4,6-trideoxy-beta-L-altropyranose hydrolase
LLLGTRYCLLRREFTAWREWRREIAPVAHKVLVTMGGSDPENVTARVMKALQIANIQSSEASIIVGGSNPHFSELQVMASQLDFPLQLYRDASNMAELMCWADLAVSAAGSTCWELAFLGVPALLLDLAENQLLLAQQLHNQNYAIHVGNRHASAEELAHALQSLVGSQELREMLSLRSRRLVDGEGAKRVASVLFGKTHLTLRPVTRDDRELLWQWANDPLVRNASFSSEPIPWETHVAWFSEKIGSPRTEMFIAEDEHGSPIGQIRFDLCPDGDWEVDVSVAQPMRGHGLATELIRLGLDALRGKRGSANIHAFVKPSNVASVKGFERSGFRRDGTKKVQGCDVVHLAIEQN